MIVQLIVAATFLFCKVALSLTINISSLYNKPKPPQEAPPCGFEGMKLMLNDLSGQQFGRYRLVRRLGYGGFASVYLGQHILLDSQQAAIKILHLTILDIDAFRREANTTATLAHPHIVRLLDFDIQQDTPYLVLDYAPNGSLLNRHPKGTQLPLATIVQYVKDIATALQYAHERNIIHRDIKPENILVGRHSELLLSDFGIAVLSKTGRTSLEQNYNSAGTAEYMSPEMFRGKPEKASDQYSLGIVVYEWLCGTPPFTEGNPIQLGFQHCYEPIPSLREKLPTVSERVEQIIMKALAKEPQQRYATVTEFAEALEEVSKAPPIGTRLLTYTDHSKAVRTLAWSPDGSRIASGSWNETVQVWDVKSGRLLFTYNSHSAGVSTLGWSPDGSRIASGSGDKTVQIWEVKSGRLLLTYSGHSAYVRTLGWSPDGSRIASGSEDGRVQVWDVSSGRLLLTYSGHPFPVYTLGWSPDGSRIASGSYDKTVQVWDVSSGRLLLTYSGHSLVVNTLGWSPDGSRIASGSWDKTVQVWDVKSSRLLLTYNSHSHVVHTLGWSSDGSRIASGSYDKTVQVWDVSSGRLLLTYSGHSADVNTLAWSPDGTRIASGSDDKTVQVWQAE